MMISLNGTSLHVEDAGDPRGSPVVFVHGFPFSGAMWQPQVAAVNHRHRVVTYDLRGMGRSAVGDGQYTIEGHVDDLIALLDHLGLTSPVIVGLSMGGYVTLRAVERHPERFRAVVLCDTRSEADDDAAKLKRAAGVAGVKRDGAAAFAEAFIPAVFAPGSLKAKPEAVSLIRETIAATPPLAIAGQLLAMAGRTDTSASLARIAVPTLILCGELDSVTPPALSRAMHERIPGSQLALVPGAGHLSNLEDPGFFNARLLDFLTGIGD
ncbi:MAG: alpha/beta fold hydrolase [bacterium]